MTPARPRRLRLENLHRPGGWLSPAFVAIDERGVVASIHETEPEGWTSNDVLALPGFAVPGMPNLHSHAFQRAMAGLAEHASGGDDSFWTWRERMYDLALRITPDQLEAVSAQLYVEMLEAGMTSVAEFHYLHHAPDGRPYADRAELGLRVLAAAESAGIGVTLLPVLYAHAGPGMPLAPHQRRFGHADVASFLDLAARLAREAGTVPHARVGLGLHSLRAVAPDEVRDALDGFASIDRGAPVHLHIAEQRAEVDACTAHLGQRPVAFLFSHVEVDARFCLVHATHVDAAERQLLARSAAVAGLCPTTEANLGDGLFPLADFLAEGGRLGVGSDSQIAVGAARELSLLEYGQRLAHERRNVAADRLSPNHRHSGRRLYDAALAGGAQALGQPVGSLEPGMRADVVVLDPAHPRMIGHGPATALDAFVFSAGEPAVRDVLAGGAHVVVGGRHLGRRAIFEAFERAMRALVETS